MAIDGAKLVDVRGSNDSKTTHKRVVKINPEAQMDSKSENLVE